MPQPYNAAQMGDALRNYFGQGAAKIGPQRPESMKSQQPPQPGYGPVPYQDAVRALGTMNNGEIYTNPAAYQRNLAGQEMLRAVYGMPQGMKSQQPPAPQRFEQRPFDAQFRAQFPGQGTRPAPNPTVR